MIVDNLFVDDNIKFIASTPNNGCFLTYDSGDFSGTRAYATAVDAEGSVIAAFSGGVRLSDNESDQFIKGLVKTSSGYFVIWKDQRSGSSDIYGQMVDFNGHLLGPSDGIPIVTASNDQQSPTLTYNNVADEVMVCWEDFRNGTDFDIYCSIVNGSTLSVTSDIELCTYTANQKTPNAYSTLDSSKILFLF